MHSFTYLLLDQSLNFYLNCFLGKASVSGRLRDFDFPILGPGALHPCFVICNELLQYFTLDVGPPIPEIRNGMVFTCQLRDELRAPFYRCNITPYLSPEVGEIKLFSFLFFLGQQSKTCRSGFHKHRIKKPWPYHKCQVTSSNSIHMFGGIIRYIY